jgi:hypothetical protein
MRRVFIFGFVFFGLLFFWKKRNWKTGWVSLGRSRLLALPEPQYDPLTELSKRKQLFIAVLSYLSPNDQRELFVTKKKFYEFFYKNVFDVFPILKTFHQNELSSQMYGLIMNAFVKTTVLEAFQIQPFTVVLEDKFLQYSREYGSGFEFLRGENGHIKLVNEQIWYLGAIPLNFGAEVLISYMTEEEKIRVLSGFGHHIGKNIFWCNFQCTDGVLRQKLHTVENEHGLFCRIRENETVQRLHRKIYLRCADIENFPNKF